MYILIVLFTLIVSFKLKSEPDASRASNTGEKVKSTGVSTRGKGGSSLAGGEKPKPTKYIPDNIPYRCLGKVPEYSLFTSEKYTGVLEELPDQIYSLKEGGRVCNVAHNKQPVLQEYKDVRKYNCPCKLCDLSEALKTVAINGKDNSIFLCNKDIVFNFQNKVKAYHVHFEINGLNSNQRIAYGLAEYTDALKVQLKTGKEDYADNVEDETKKLFAGPIVVKTVDVDWTCDISGIDTNRVIAISDNWCADGKYVIGKNNPSGWLNINIADNGSVTVPMRCQGSNKCKNCTSLLKRTIIDESANWDCDFDGCDEKIKQGDIVYECALNDKICDAVFHAKHFTKDTIIKENEILKPYRSKDKKKAIVGMGYDGYSFYISNRGDGRRYGLKQFNHGPSSFREYVWGLEYIPVVIIYTDGAKIETNSSYAVNVDATAKKEQIISITSRSKAIDRYNVVSDIKSTVGDKEGKKGGEEDGN